MMEDALTRQTAERLIEAATTAPSLNNSQPWQFVAWPADRVIEIYADPARARSRGDPRGRAVHIACGSALFNLRLAIARAGCLAVVVIAVAGLFVLLLHPVALLLHVRLFFRIRRHVAGDRIATRRHRRIRLNPRGAGGSGQREGRGSNRKDQTGLHGHGK